MRRLCVYLHFETGGVVFLICHTNFQSPTWQQGKIEPCQNPSSVEYNLCGLGLSPLQMHDPMWASDGWVGGVWYIMWQIQSNVSQQKHIGLKPAQLLAAGFIAMEIWARSTLVGWVKLQQALYAEPSFCLHSILVCKVTIASLELEISSITDLQDSTP